MVAGKGARSLAARTRFPSSSLKKAGLLLLQALRFVDGGGGKVALLGHNWCDHIDICDERLGRHVDYLSWLFVVDVRAQFEPPRTEVYTSHVRVLR